GAEVFGLPEDDVGQAAGGEGADLVGEAVGDGGVDGELGHVAEDAVVVVRGFGAAFGFHLGGYGEGAADGLAGPAHALGVGRCDRDDAEVVQNVLGAHGRGPDPVVGELLVAGEVRGEAVGIDDHVVVLGH